MVRFLTHYEVYERTQGCVTVAVSEWPPLVVIDTFPFSGTHVDVFRLVMESLKMCYYLAATPDQQWGDKLNGTWTGMVGMVDRKQAEIALGPLAITHLRTEVVNFATAYMNCDNNFLYKAITKIQPDILIFTKAFNMLVWGYVAASVVVVALFSVLTHRGYNWIRDSAMKKKGDDSDWGKVEVDLFMQLMWSPKIFLAQDHWHGPEGDGSRTLSITWCLMTLILALMYKCNLKAILITGKITPPFDSTEDLVEQTEYKWNLLDGTYYGGYFRGEYENFPDTVRGRMWPMREIIPLYDVANTVPAVLERKVAVVAPRVFHIGFIALDFSEVGTCRLAYTNRGFHDVFLTWAYPHGSPLRDPVDMMTLRVIQAGLPDQITNYQLRNASWCTHPPKKNSNESRPFGMGDYHGVFMVYGLGHFIALVAFILEHVLSASKRRKKIDLMEADERNSGAPADTSDAFAVDRGPAQQLVIGDP